jgi:transposase-like protein
MPEDINVKLIRAFKCSETRNNPKCPYCGSEDLTPIKSWRFRFYDVAMYRCNRCGGEFNHYVNTTGKGKPEYYVRIKPRPTITH